MVEVDEVDRWGLPWGEMLSAGTALNDKPPLVRSRNLWLFPLMILATILLAAPTARGEEVRVVGIAPTEADVEAMRRTIKRLEGVINRGGAPGDAQPLLSPHLTEADRDAILHLIEELGTSLPEDSAYHIRTDFTRASLTPTGTEKVQLQVTATQIIRFAMHDESIQLELEAVESDGRRRWLISDLGFPGQQTLLPKELSHTPRILIVVAAGTVALALLALGWWIWRRRSRRR